jgi:NitT/TauT family transport system substrate-binding protein
MRITTAATLAVLISLGVQAQAETMKLAVGQRGTWDTSVAEIGVRGGIFQKHGLELEILYTQGGGETQQAVISGSVDVGVAAGMMGVLAAFAKGAPVRIIGSEMTGATEMFFYVPAKSKIQSLKDIGTGTIGYSTNGSSTHGVVTALVKQYDLKAQPVATGSQSATLTQVLSGQIDVGWSAPPFGLDQLDRGDIRIVASGNDATVFRGQTVRLLIANAQALQSRKDTFVRFMRAYRETVDWMYAGDGALKAYGEFMKMPEAKVASMRDRFFPKSAIDPDKVVGLDVIVQDAVTLKFTPAPLTQAQLAELIQIPPR